MIVPKPAIPDERWSNVLGRSSNAQPFVDG
jgi:hypothetical protein